MGIPQLEGCCCGCTLRTGTKIIGWISLVCGVFMVIMMGIGLTTLYYIEGHPEQHSKEADEIRQHLPAMKALTIFLIVVHITTSALAVILLLGVYQQKAKFVLTWVVVALTSVLLEQSLNIAQSMVAFNAGSLLFSFLYLVVDLYFILVVYSFYREIKTVSTYA